MSNSESKSHYCVAVSSNKVLTYLETDLYELANKYAALQPRPPAKPSPAIQEESKEMYVELVFNLKAENDQLKQENMRQRMEIDKIKLENANMRA